MADALDDSAGVPAPRTPSPCSHFRLRSLMRLAGRLYDAEIGACGLRTTQYSLLNAVRAAGPVTPGELAGRLALDPSTLSRNLRPMIDAGWLVLEPGGDGRTRRVSITPSGEARRRQARAAWQRAQRHFEARLGADRVAELNRLLDECRAILETDPLPKPDRLLGHGAGRLPADDAPETCR